MTVIGTQIVAVLAAGSVAAGALFGADAAATGGADRHASPIALVIDASLARDGRQLVDARLEGVDAEVRLPRDPREASTNVRYFDDLGYTVIVAGRDATGAAEDAGEPAVYAAGLPSALDAAR